jgi:glycosyltransferase involved in cell wall biosynthesis
MESKMNVKSKVFIATPMYGGMCTGDYAGALLNCVAAFAGAGIQMYFARMQNESLITRARNRLAYDFLRSGADHLMFIDADIGFNPDDIVKMVEADKDIICGLYPKKEINWNTVAKAVTEGVPANKLHEHTGAFVVNLVGGAEKQEGKLYEPMEIANGGTGFMLIKRQVFEALKDKVPTYTNDIYFAVESNPNKDLIHEFFATSIDEETNRLLSEDYHFCKLARQHGFKVYAAPWAQLIHTGTYSFSGQLART